MPGCEGYISELFLAPTARGGGMGAALLQAAETEARRRGCARLGLLNDRDRESYQRQFYAKHGWTERPTMASFVRPLPGTPDIA
jgi:GNAT superfamily N-acetyltransferase